jgi:hypothetical protein
MADADNQDQTSPNQQNVGVTKTELDAKLGEVNEQLRAMNATFQESIQAIASAVKPQQQTRQQPVFNDDVMYDPNKLESAVKTQASQIAGELLRKERELNTAVYNLSQEYPEITSDPGIQKAVREAQATLPESIRDTAIGIETAVLKAASKAGLVPKSKRQAQLDDDISVGPRSPTGGGQRNKGSKNKVAAETMELAELMGLNTEDPKVAESIAKHAQRDSWSRYR